MALATRSTVRVSKANAVAFRALPQATRRIVAAPSRSMTKRVSVMVKAELKVGDNMKDSSEYYRVLRSSDGKSVQLASFQGKQPMVLFFYPKAGTPGCTKEACKFRDEYAAFVKAGAAVFGVSGDTPEENAAFARANNLNYPLLSDQSNILRKTFGIKGEMLGLLPGRQTYVIDKNGKVILSFNDMLNAEKHVEEALKAINSIAVNA